MTVYVNARIVCPRCGKGGDDCWWRDWRCKRCGAFHAELYRKDHADPARAARMSEAELLAEWEAAA